MRHDIPLESAVPTYQKQNIIQRFAQSDWEQEQDGKSDESRHAHAEGLQSPGFIRGKGRKNPCCIQRFVDRSAASNNFLGKPWS